MRWEYRLDVITEQHTFSPELLCRNLDVVSSLQKETKKQRLNRARNGKREWIENKIKARKKETKKEKSKDWTEKEKSERTQWDKEKDVKKTE